jgi:acetyl-CoA carboxylase carboxyl transferase subunit alpha
MSTRVLDFEKPIVELEGKIRELKLLLAGGNEDSCSASTTPS